MARGDLASCRPIRVAVLILLALAIAPAYAHAGTYEVRLCAGPGSAGLVERNDAPSAFGLSATCPGNPDAPSSGLAAFALVNGQAPGSDQRASWTITAPTGTTLRQVSALRALDKRDRNYEVLVRTGDGAMLEACAVGGTCAELAATKVWGPMQAQSLWFGVRCAPTRTCSNSTLFSPAWIAVYSATVTIDDPDAPAVDPPATPGGWTRNAAIRVDASDASGVKSVELVADGRTVGTSEQACDYTRLRPCPASVSAPVAVDLPDGTHTIRAVAVDAADQSRSSATSTLRLDRTPPGSPLDLTVEPAPSGGGYVYRWRNPDQGAGSPIVAAHYARGNDTEVVRRAGITSFTAPTDDLAVWLEDEAGNADRATAVNRHGAVLGDIADLPPAVVGTSKPVLRPAAASPRLRIKKATRAGRTLTIHGTIARTATAKVTATLTRGRRTARASTKPRRGRWTIRLKLKPAMRKPGRLALTVRYAGQAAFTPATARRTVLIR